jgi:hypothetical protein
MQLSLSQSLQPEMRRTHLDGAPGVSVSGIVWLVSAIVCYRSGVPKAVWTLLIGGALISPLSKVFRRLLGAPPGAKSQDALTQLALATTIWLIACCFMAYGLYLHDKSWFFPAMMLTIGGRYLVFSTLFGLAIYWVLGGLLICAGALAFHFSLPAMYSALAGATIELVFAVILFSRLRRG